jgi:Na+-driven multidrug efflux pump
VRPPDREMLGEIWHVAWPSSTQLVVRIAAMLVVNSLIARAFTTAEDQTATTAFGIVFRLETLALFVSMGWGSAAQTFVGQNLGACQRDRAQRSGLYAAAYSGALMVGIAVLYQFAARPIVASFDETARVVEISIGYVSSVSWSYLGLGTGVVLGCAITGAGATRTTLMADLAVVLGVQIPACVAAVMLPGATLHRLWMAVAIAYALSGIVYVAVFRRARWMEAAPAGKTGAG